MSRKKILERKQLRLTAKKNALLKRAEESNDVNEVRDIHSQLKDITDELTDIADELAAIAEEEDDNGDDNGDGNSNDDGNNGNSDEGRSRVPIGAVVRGGNPMASYNLARTQQREATGYGSMEYRMAFKNYVQKGIDIPADVAQRAADVAGPTTTNDLGAIIPTTIMNEFINEVSKTYGQVYSKVRKLNVRGGVKFPIAKLKANFKWVTETTVSDKQKAGTIKDYVTFEYNLGEIRVSESLVAQVVSLAAFEEEIVKVLVEAYLEAMDKGIISGTGEGQLLGIANDPRVTNIVEMTAADFANWTAWRKNLFAKVPLSKRGKAEFMFPASTVESYLLTMEDKNGRPLFREATDGTVGNLVGSFFGRDVTLVEPDVIADFDTANAGDIVGIYWVPNDYAINSNMEFGIKRYFDENANEWVNKGLTIVDGKILDATGCFIIKKKA